MLPGNASARRGSPTKSVSPLNSSSPVSNTSAHWGGIEPPKRRYGERLAISQTALFGPKTVSLRCHRFVTLSFGAEKCAKGLEKRVLVAREVELRDISPQSHSCQHACLGKVGSGLVVPQAFFDRNYRSIHRIMPSGRASGNSVEVLVNFAEGAQTVSSDKFAGRPRGCCAGVRLRICRFSLFEKLLKSQLRYVGKKHTCRVTNSTPTWRLRYLARQARS